MKYSGRIKWPVSRRLYAGRARNRGIDADHFFRSLRFFCNSGRFFLLEASDSQMSAQS